MHRPSITLSIASLVALAALVTVAVAPGAAAENITVNATVDVHPDRAPEAQDPEDLLTLENWTRNASFEWNLTADANYTVIDIRLHEGFNVTRGRQIVPLIDGRHFVELQGFDGPLTVDRPATVFNLTQGAGPNATDAGNVSWTYRIGIPGPAEANLTLHRDVTPPDYEMEPPRNITHIGFDLVTRTAEVSLATLHIQPPPESDEEPQTYPQPRPSPLQRYPVQGLEPNTTYTYHVTFQDWSLNEATSDAQAVTTAEEPDPPVPEVTPTSPLPNSTVSPEGVTVRAEWSSPESPVVLGGIRLFVDKEPIPADEFDAGDGVVSYTVPKPLPTREVSASVEVPNQAGGEGLARWSFHVEEQETATNRDTPVGPAVALLGLAGAAAALRRPR